jgi:preprotein translocase subunit SecY
MSEFIDEADPDYGAVWRRLAVIAILPALATVAGVTRPCSVLRGTSLIIMVVVLDTMNQVKKLLAQGSDYDRIDEDHKTWGRSLEYRLALRNRDDLTKLRRTRMKASAKVLAQAHGEVAAKK